MIYAFENFLLDTRRCELRRGDELVHVEPQVFQLLTHLVAERDRVVTRDELFETIWCNRAVSDTALSSRVRSARKALGDDGVAQRLIRTVQRRGFRFVGEAREMPPAEAIVAPAQQTDAAKRADDAETLIQDVMQRSAVAVLPFIDAAGDPTSRYLEDGITDEVIAALCAWRCFPVISRNTVFQYRQTTLSAPEIGRAIGARYLLTGTIRRDAARIKISAALIDAPEDRQIWSGHVIRPIDEIFTLEEALAQDVAIMLEPELRGAEVQRILRKPSNDANAWDLAMRASWCVNRGDPDFDEAERLASEAAERAPDWYLPYAIIASARFNRAMRSFSASDARTAFAETLAAARLALSIENGSWLAHALTAVGELWTNLHYDCALEHVHRALELNPSASQAYHFGGCIVGFSGDPGKARRHQERIFRIDPAYPYRAVIEADIGLWHLVEHQLEAADKHLDRAIQWDQRYGRAYQRRVSLAGLTGDREASERALARLVALGIPLTGEQIKTSYPFRNQAHRDVFFDGLRRSGLNL